AAAPTQPTGSGVTSFLQQNVRLIAIIAAALLALLLIIFLLRARAGASEANVLFPQATSTPAPPLDSAANLALRDKAAADLRQRIERLPGQAVPPLYTF